MRRNIIWRPGSDPEHDEDREKEDASGENSVVSYNRHEAGVLNRVDGWFKMAARVEEGMQGNLLERSRLEDMNFG